MSYIDHRIENGKAIKIEYDLEVFDVDENGVLSFSITRDDGTRYCGEVSKCDECNKGN